MKTDPNDPLTDEHSPLRDKVPEKGVKSTSRVIRDPKKLAKTDVGKLILPIPLAPVVD